MAGARSRGRTYLEFIGGEMTIRPDFLYLIRSAKKLGFETIMMATNGRMLSYFDYAKSLADAGLNSVVFSIHGHNAKEHDKLTQAKGSFGQLMKGLDNMKKLLGERRLGTNTTIVKQNYKDIEKIGKLILKKGLRNSEFIFVDCNEGGAYNDFNKFVPKISLAAPYIKKCLAMGKKAQAAHWHIRYVPLCYFPDYLEQISELDEIKRFQTEHLAPDFINLEVERSRPEAGRVKTKKCAGCKLHGQCEGIWKNYYEHYGDSELKPLI
jgi:MoaA/NifB/PqqE/SkfB family radical SAM enzyme